MDARAAEWFARRTSRAADWDLSTVHAAKSRAGLRISVVIPARDEEATVGDVVSRIRAELVDAVPLVDELVVMDSLSSDATARRATDAGATVHPVTDVRAELGVRRGKGEALWKSQFVTSGDVLVFVDADLTDWGAYFVTALVGPMLADPGVELVKGFYDRVLDEGDEPAPQGGRVTELVARPLLALRRPQLSGVVQPLAGEWAIRRSLFEALPVPVGYGVELATLLDTESTRGLDAVAQVDLGRRAHRHQSVHDLGVMAAEILAVADRRAFGTEPAGAAELDQFERSADGGRWRTREVPVDERPPGVSVIAERRAG